MVPLIIALGRKKQADLYEFHASQDIVRSCLKPEKFEMVPILFEALKNNKKNLETFKVLECIYEAGKNYELERDLFLLPNHKS